jgi:hypothetical protein
MDLTYGPIALICSRDIHGKLLVIIPEGGFFYFYKSQLLARVGFSSVGVAAIIEQMKLISIEISA